MINNSTMTAKNITEQQPKRILPARINRKDRVLIAELINKSYRDGFLNGMAIRQDGLASTQNTN